MSRPRNCYENSQLPRGTRHHRIPSRQTTSGRSIRSAFAEPHYSGEMDVTSALNTRRFLEAHLSQAMRSRNTAKLSRMEESEPHFGEVRFSMGSATCSNQLIDCSRGL